MTTASPFKAVAFDYDGTLADHEVIADGTRAALADARADGLTVVLVTGRTLRSLRAVCPDADDLFDAVVAENGAVLADATGVRLLAEPVDPELTARLQAQGIPAEQGDVLVATKAFAAADVFAAATALDLDVQLVRNRSELMVLPAGVTKASGLHEALDDLGISFHSTVAVGDADNDLAMLELCEVAVAVGNATHAVVAHADVVVEQPDGEGSAALLRGPVLRGERPVRSTRRRIRLGTAGDGAPVDVAASQLNLLVTGGSRSGKSYFTGVLVEQLVTRHYAVLVVDPEGDYAGVGDLPGAVVLTAPGPGPAVEHDLSRETVRLIGHRFGSVVVDVSLLGHGDRRAVVADTLAHVALHRVVTGAPHWLVLDEAHHFLADPTVTRAALSPSASGTCLVTYRPEALPRDALRALDAAVVLPFTEAEDGTAPTATLARTFGVPADELRHRLAGLGPGRALLVRRAGRRGTATAFTVLPRHTVHVRHRHKYADHELPDHLRFVFREGDHDPGGPRAGSVESFHRALREAPRRAVAHHAGRHDFSRWMDEALQDPQLADAVEDAEDLLTTAPGTIDRIEVVRRRVLHEIERRYLS